MVLCFVVKVTKHAHKQIDRKERERDRQREKNRGEKRERVRKRNKHLSNVSNHTQHSFFPMFAYLSNKLIHFYCCFYKPVYNFISETLFTLFNNELFTVFKFKNMYPFRDRYDQK